MTGCGKEQWLVKTPGDPMRDRVDYAHVKDATASQLASMNVTPDSIVGMWRAAPIELTVYRVDAILVGILGEQDGDDHLILADPNDQNATMIAEMPNSNCEGACMSGFAGRYAAARLALEEHAERGTGRGKPFRVRVTGAGFGDRPHGQAGAAPNQFELHPVLKIEFP
jgi:hypothetical protein